MQPVCMCRLLVYSFNWTPIMPITPICIGSYHICGNRCHVRCARISWSSHIHRRMYASIMCAAVASVAAKILSLPVCPAKIMAAINQTISSAFYCSAIKIYVNIYWPRQWCMRPCINICTWMDRVQRPVQKQIVIWPS